MKPGLRFIGLLFLLVLGGFHWSCAAAVPENATKDSLVSASGYDSLGKLFYQNANYQDALIFFKQALALNLEKGNAKAVIAGYEQISKVLQSQKQYKEAIPYELKAIEIVMKMAPSPLEPYYQQVKTLLSHTDDSLTMSRLYYKFGRMLSHRGEKARGIEYLNQALQLARLLKYDKAIGVISNDLGGEYWDLGEQKLSKLSYQQSLQAATRVQDSNLMAATLLNLGDNAKEEGNYSRAMELFFRALSIKEQLKDSSNLAFYYIKAGEMAKDVRRWDNWEKYINKAYGIMRFKSCASPMEQAIVYENLGGIAELNKQPKRAKLYYDTLLNLSKSIGYTNGLRVALTNLSHIYQNRGLLKKALQLLNEADQLTTENPFYRITTNNQKANIYFQLGQYTKALRLAKENYAKPELNNYATTKARTFEQLYQIYARLGNYEKALQWNDSLRVLENRLRDQDVRKKVAELETQYQTEKKEHQIELLTAQNKISQQQIRLGILLIIALFVIIMFGVYAQRITKLKAEYREGLLSQQLFRAQMNPHFIFNALTSIQNFMVKNDLRKASFFLGKFASISRLVLEYSTRESIPLSKELEILTSYIELERMRKGYLFDYKIQIDDRVETDFIEIPPMAVQPFVENAILHGLKTKGDEGMLVLSFSIENEVVRVVVEDNGQGINQAQSNKRKEHRSMAMEIFEKRRLLWEKHTGKSLPLSIIDLSKEGSTGTRVILHLPIL
jgi:tetratricopeptide (TPR) repeat protein